MVIDAETLKHQDNMADLQRALNAQPAYAIVEQAPDRSAGYIDMDNPVIMIGEKKQNDSSTAEDSTMLLAHGNHNRYRHYDRGFTACITIDFLTICEGDNYNRRDHHWNDNKRHKNKKWKNKKHKKKHHNGGGKRNRHGSLGDQFEGQASEAQEALAKNDVGVNVENKNVESMNVKSNALSGVMAMAAIDPKDVKTTMSFGDGEKFDVETSNFALTDFEQHDHHDDIEHEEPAVA